MLRLLLIRISVLIAYIISACSGSETDVPLLVARNNKLHMSSSSPLHTRTSTQQHEQIEKILQELANWQHADNHRRVIPFVTLTFAQSLDGKIAQRMQQKDFTTTTLYSSNLALSGPDSLVMTHALRSMHDAILIGGRTLSIDNPRLTNRLWPSQNQPRPVVLDSQLEHIRTLGSSCRASSIIVCCTYEAAQKEKEALSSLSVELLPCQCHKDGTLDLRHVLQRLYEAYGIRTVMVEGGAAILSGFLSERLVDCLCVTIAPKLMGNENGLAAFSKISSGILDLTTAGSFSMFLPLGTDCIYLCRLSRQREVDDDDGL